MERQLQQKNPINKGRAVNLIHDPINIAIGTAIKVDIKPDKAAPIPAICPIDCIVNARMFPKTNPKARNCIPVNKVSIYMFGFGCL